MSADSSTAPIAVLTVGLVLHVGAVALVLAHRDSQPFKARQSALLAMTAAVNGYLLIGNFVDLSVKNVSCALPLFLGYSFPLLLLGVYVLRSLVLYWKFEAISQKLQFYEALRNEAINNARAQRARRGSAGGSALALSRLSISSKISAYMSSQHQSAFSLVSMTTFNRVKKDFFFLRHNFLLKPKWQARIFFLLLAIGLTPAYAELPRALNLERNADTTCSFIVADYLIWVYYIGMICLIIFIGYKLRSPKFVDQFNLKWELKLTMILALVVYVSITIAELIISASDRKLSKAVGTYKVFAIVYLTTIISCFEPFYEYLWKQNEFKKFERLAALSRTRRTGKFAVKTLEEFIVNPTGFHAFEEYSKKEFCIENLYFWRDIREFQETAGKIFQAHGQASVVFLLQEAYEIYAGFVAMDAPLQVNLPNNVTADIRRVLRIREDDVLMLSDSISKGTGSGMGSLRVGSRNPIGSIRIKGELKLQSAVDGSTGDLDAAAKPSSFEGSFSGVSETGKPAGFEELSSGPIKPKSLNTIEEGNYEDKSSSSREVVLEIDADIGIDAAEVVTVYDKAVEEILLLMTRDTFRRFRIDPRYKEVANDIRRTQRALADMDLL